MTLMQRHMFRRLVLGTGVAALIFSVVTLLVEVSSLFSLLTTGVVTGSRFIAALLMLLPEQFYAVVPLGATIAVAHAYYEWGHNHELVSLRMAGLTNSSLAIPGMAAAAVAMLFTAANSLYLLPVSFRVFEDIRYGAGLSFAPSALDEGYLQRIGPNLSILFHRRVDALTLEGVEILDGRDAGTFTYIFADSAHFVRRPGEDPERLLVLEKGSYYKRHPSDTHVTPASFEQLIIPLSETTDGSPIHRPWRGFFEEHIGSLLYPPPIIRARPSEYGNWIAEGHKRFIMPLLCLSYAGFVIGVMLRPWQERSSGSVRVSLALASVAVWHGLILAMSSLIVSALFLVPLYYVIALIPGAVGAVLIILPGWPAGSRAAYTPSRWKSALQSGPGGAP